MNQHSHVCVAMVPNDSKCMLACYGCRRYVPAGKKKWRIMIFVCCLERLVSERRCWLNVYKISFVSHISFRSRISTKCVRLLTAKLASNKLSEVITSFNKTSNLRKFRCEISIPSLWLFDIFPNLYHVRLNLHLSGELGEPPSTLPTVSNCRRHFNHYPWGAALKWFLNFHR